MTDASASTIACWLAEHSLKLWRDFSWVFPTDPRSQRPARCPTSNEARRRIHETLAPAS